MRVNASLRQQATIRAPHAPSVSVQRQRGRSYPALYPHRHQRPLPGNNALFKVRRAGRYVMLDRSEASLPGLGGKTLAAETALQRGKPTRAMQLEALGVLDRAPGG